MGKTKFYAVVKGRKPGIYHEWFGAGGAEVQIKGFAGAVYKGFGTHEEARAWTDQHSAGLPARRQTAPLVFADAEATRARKPIRPKETAEERPRHHAENDGAGVIIYSDGGCRNNPGPGGYGVVLFRDGRREELSGGYARTTNNRMELTACIKGLETLDQRCSVIVYSDSQYVVNGVTKGWARRWKRNNWMRNDAEQAENSDLWSRLLDLCDKHDVEFRWVRGHNGNQENERCDVLAVEMSHRGDLPPDDGYNRK